MSHSSLFGSDDELDDSEHASVIGTEGVDGLPWNEDGATVKLEDTIGNAVANIKSPNIKGFYLLRDLIPLELQERLLRRILEEKAVTAQHPQAMLFPRCSQSGKDSNNCPPYLSDFVKLLPELLQSHLSPEDLEAVFEERLPLQTIINLYEPGQGITPHVDLPHRYAHPIVGVSLASATVMEFVSLDEKHRQAVLIRPGDVYVLLQDARYNYKHGIAYRDIDLWRDEEGAIRQLYRGTRVSITFRRMLSTTSELSVEA